MPVFDWESPEVYERMQAEAETTGLAWECLRPKANLLVLDATRKTMSDAPQVTHDESMTTEQFNQESPKVDAYWKAHLSQKSSN